MAREAIEDRYQNQVATVVGGRGELGKKIVSGLTDIGFGQVLICEQGDSFADFVPQSGTIFFAVDANQTLDMLKAAGGSHLLKPSHNILDGASVKTALIPVYQDLDNLGISVSSTHLGAMPAHPWRGVKVWLCEVGPNSKRAQRLALDLFIAKNTSITKIDIEDHANVERVQWFTFATTYLLAETLRRLSFPLERFNQFSTLNAELMSLPLGRTLGQGTKVPSEILSTQPMKDEYLEAMSGALEELAKALSEREKLQKMMGSNIEFHDEYDGGRIGYIERIFSKAGIVGSRNANLRMYSLSFRITDDRPGKLKELLKPFDDEGVNITAIDSMVGIPTQTEREEGVDPDRIIDFHIGVDLETLKPVERERRIQEALREMGCRIDYSGHKLS